MIFIDTSAFLALENRKDHYHQSALMFRDSLLESKQPLVTSGYVLDESYTIIRLRAGHKIAVRFGEMIQAGDLEWHSGFGRQTTWPAGLPAFMGIPIDHCLHGRGFDTVQRRVGLACGSDHRALRVTLRQSGC